MEKPDCLYFLKIEMFFGKWLRGGAGGGRTREREDAGSKCTVDEVGDTELVISRGPDHPQRSFGSGCLGNRVRMNFQTVLGLQEDVKNHNFSKFPGKDSRVLGSVLRARAPTFSDGVVPPAMFQPIMFRAG